MNQEFLNDVVTCITGAQELLEKTAAEREELAKETPGLVDLLIAQGIADPSEKQALATHLAEPMNLVKALRKVAQTVQPRSMGRGEKKAASAPSARKSQSDQYFESVFLS